MLVKIAIASHIILGAALAHAQQLAFPEAEGYGKYTVGGRGGTVYEVTNLGDSGAGSLRAAVEASGPRTVVFRVSGTIVLTKNLTINNPYITIAGQTAPGDGICLRKYNLGINADQVIIRYIRARYGDEVQVDADAISMRYRKNIILDHVSGSWGDDETLSLYHGENITVQWCLISETLNRGGDHGFAGIWGSPYSTFHHNLVAHCVSRNMRFASGCGNTDYRNNVIYNWGYNSAYGGEKQQPGNATFYFANVNMVNNYYKPGPRTDSGVSSRIVNPTYRSVKTDYGQFYVSGNYVVGNATVTADNWNGGVSPAGGSGDIPLVRLTTPWPAMAINQQTAQDAYTSVLAHVGCSKPVRDSVDARIINEVSTGTATYGDRGIIQSQSEVGGWPTLNSSTAPTDTDHDGMPDSWETAHGSNPNDAADRNGDLDGDGYTNLEEYLNELGAFGTPPSNTSPTVSVTSPANGATFTAPASIAINANASDSDGTISSVAFYQGSTLLGTDTTSPYSFTWNSVAAGSYSLTARATDDDGATTTSSAVSVTVNAAGNTPPSASITSPANGATFTAPASIAINANASDSDGTISSVAFYQGSTLLGTDTTSPYSFTWNSVAAGSYSLTARATDDDGATTTSSAVSVTVNAAGNTPPSASITSPANGATFTAPASITINANASDTDGTISSVEFYQGSTLLGTDTTSPYSFTWNSVAAGSYSLTARATDNSGATTTSAAVSITVNSSGGGSSVAYQAEAYTSQSGNTVQTTYSGYTGSGYVDFGGNGTWLEWNNIGGGGSTLAFRYANGSTVNRQCELRVNGTVIGNLSMVPTGNWTTWATNTVTVTINPGNNTIRLTANTSNGGPNLDSVTATVSGSNTPPTASITSPANGATFTAPASITINASASDSDGTISSVAFYQGATLLGTDTTSPYSFTWNSVAAGSYSLTARAIDNGGATTISAAVTITVNPPSGSDNIAWSPVQSITGDANVSTAGTLVRAANLTKNGGSYDANVTLNGVTFVRAPHSGTTTTLANGDTLVTSDSTTVGAYEGFGGSTAPFSGLSANYQTLLRSGHYNDGDLANTAGTARITLTLKNLTVGTQYQVQIWVNDYRVVNLGQTNPGLITVVADSATSATLEHNVQNALGGIGQYVIGTFTATATTKVITLTGGNTGTDTSVPNCTAIWNAYQLRAMP